MFEFVADSEANEKDINIIEAGLREYNKKHTGLNAQKKRAVYIKEDGKILGGIVYVCMQPWAYVNLLWVSDELRGKGYGSKLLKNAEDDAKKQGSSKIMLDTFSYQAPEFYKKQGYNIISEINGYPIDGVARYWLSKEL
jgi:ribosomal protein S18 acetylase RimI-like enzyme